MLGVVRAAALLYPRAQRSPGARRGPRGHGPPPVGKQHGLMGFTLSTSEMGSILSFVCVSPSKICVSFLHITTSTRLKINFFSMNPIAEYSKQLERARSHYRVKQERVSDDYIVKVKDTVGDILEYMNSYYPFQGDYFSQLK